MEDVQRLVVDEIEHLLLVYADNRLVDRVDEGLDIALGDLQFGQRGVMVVAQASCHPVEVGRQLLHLTAAGEMQFGVVVVIGNLIDASCHFQQRSGGGTGELH